ncbi:MAG TPA: cysteine--tRNA ligase [Patescibacteria group bacterium]|nr:cysteine--tRNA ligase [Patescibacteria group bacterium]
MRLYNTSSRQIEDFIPMDEEDVLFYSCGPTVYDKSTVGNWASFIRYDLLARTIKTCGYKLNWVMNITDVGHLVSDADEGEDKLEKGAKREHKTAWEIAESYTADFLEGLDYFNISVPRSNIFRATDFIKDQIELIKTLEKKGHTYKTGDGIYFDSTTFEDYGKMARLDISGLQSGARVQSGDKKHPTDFALWKFSPVPPIDGKKRDMEWESPWGVGFPGWHIECSAIVIKKLAETIDIHTGGIEHIPIHHTNEIAQSEAVTGKTFVNTWVHNNHLKVEGQKISKSLNNGYTIEDLKQQGFSADDFRMFVLQSNYRTEANFSWKILKEAREKRLQLQSIADLRFQSIQDSAEGESLSSFISSIKKSLSDNINTPEVVATLSEFIQKLSGKASYSRQELIDFFACLEDSLGFRFLASEDITSEAKELIRLREEARASKDWSTSDKIRDQLEQLGIGVKDTETLSIWFRLS